MIRKLLHILALGLKELNSIRADPILLALTVYTFSYAVYAVATGAKTEVDHVSTAIVDEDHSELSRLIRQAILPPWFQPPVEIPATEIGPSMDASRYVFVIEIPPKFEQDVISNRYPSLQINMDATAVAQAGNGGAYLQQIINQQVQAYATRAGGTATTPSGTEIQPVNFAVRVMFNPNLKSEWFNSVMQVINNITMLSVILTGAALIREREHGTIEHLLAMPVTPSEIMLSKIWANGLVILVAAILSMKLVVQLWLQVPVAGSLVLFLAGAVVYAFSVTSMGILLATYTTSMGQFGLLVIPVLVILQMLSGSATPMETMPVWLQDAMQIFPTPHFVSFSQAVLYRAAGIDVVWPELLVMAIISAVYFTISGVRYGLQDESTRINLAAILRYDQSAGSDSSTGQEAQEGNTYAHTAREIVEELRRGDFALVLVNRGGSHSADSSAELRKTIPNPKPQCTSALGFASCMVRTASVTSCAVCARDASATMRMPLRLHASRKFLRYPSPTRDCSTSTPTSVCPLSASRSVQKVGSSVCDPIGNAKNHSPSARSDPVTLMQGTLKRSSIASFTGIVLSPILGPKIAKHPSSQSSP